MGCLGDVLKKTSPLDVFGNVSEKVKHLTNDASNDVSPPALRSVNLSNFDDMVKTDQHKQDGLAALFDLILRVTLQEMFD